MGSTDLCRGMAFAAATMVAVMAWTTSGCQTSQSQQPADEVVVTQPDAQQDAPPTTEHQPQHLKADAEDHQPTRPLDPSGDDAPVGNDPAIGDNLTTGEAEQAETDDDDVRLPTADQHRDSALESGDTGQPPQTGSQRKAESAPEQLDGRSSPPSPAPEDQQPQPGPNPPQQLPAGNQLSDDIPTSGDDVDDNDVQDFAAAYIGVQDLNYQYEQRLNATTDPEETNRLHQELQQQTTKVIKSNNLSVQQFRAIAQLVESDSELRDRIQSEIDAIAH